MCDFRHEMKVETVERPRIGYKVTRGDLAGILLRPKNVRCIGRWMRAVNLYHRREHCWHGIDQCRCKPGIANAMGWYIYRRREDALRAVRSGYGPVLGRSMRAVVRRVRYKGRCVYGRNDYPGDQARGVRAEWVKFEE